MVSTLLTYYLLICKAPLLFFFNVFIYILERGEVREKEREGEKGVRDTLVGCQVGALTRN